MDSIILVYKYDRLINLLLILTNDDTNNINFSEFTFYEWIEIAVCAYGENFDFFIGLHSHTHLYEFRLNRIEFIHSFTFLCSLAIVYYTLVSLGD